MKIIAFIIAFFFLSSNVIAQVKEGKITYERKVQFNIQVSDNNPAFQNMIPRERKDKFELLFANNKTLWKPAEAEQNEDAAFGDEGGGRVVIRMMGNDDISYNDLGAARRVEQRELGGKNFIIADSIRRMNWKVAGETKTILGYKCMKATTQRTQEASRMQMENGSAKREVYIDTLNVVAWFTSEIPGSYGPDIYQGQLPGTILEIDINNGRSTYIALNVDKKVDASEIKEPSKGKKLTTEEFAKEREKLFQEMQQNGGGQRRIRMGN